jgi:hypothetical protein
MAITQEFAQLRLQGDFPLAPTLALRHISPMLSPAPDAHTKTPPAKRWRNFYRVYHMLNLYPLGPIGPGVHAGPSVFASKDLAESHARAFLAELNPPETIKPRRYLMDHAGAYPEGDAAN